MRSRLHQILRNLLSNAFKFTSEGEVALTISKMSLAHPQLKDQETDVIAFSVSDTGIGIAENKLLQDLRCIQTGGWGYGT